MKYHLAAFFLCMLVSACTSTSSGTSTAEIGSETSTEALPARDNPAANQESPSTETTLKAMEAAGDTNNLVHAAAPRMVCKSERVTGTYLRRTVCKEVGSNTRDPRAADQMEEMIRYQEAARRMDTIRNVLN